MPRALSRTRILEDAERLAVEETRADALFGRLLAVLDEAFGFEGACWHLTDPISGDFMRIGVQGDLPGTFDSALHYELHEDDVVKFAELRDLRAPVGVLSAATSGRPEQSARFRELHRPDGYAWSGPGFVDS